MKIHRFRVYLASLFVVFSLHLTSTPAGVLPEDGEAQYELEFWESIRDSTDAEDYEAYLEAYPDGKFAPLARSRAERYRAADAPGKAESAVVVTDMDIHYAVVIDANIRRAPTSQSEKLGILRRGNTVHVTGQVAGKPWYRIEHDGGTGFVFAELLRKPEPAASRAPARPQPPPAPAKTEAAAKPKPEEPTVTAGARSTHEVIRDCPSCPEMILLPPGRFIMGDNRGDPSERPAHEVSIRQPFAIGKYEVTAAQWNECVRAGGCTHELKGEPAARSPVRDVNWSDAQQYVRWLGKVTGKEYRLPTEAEWEYAARGGTTSRYWWGDKLGSGNANCTNCGGPWEHDNPAEVGTFPANPFGLHDTSGGVWEWVADCWHRSYEGAPTDGSSWGKSDCREYVIRGGAWRNDSTYVHSASRFKYDAYVRYLMNGFRVARNMP